MPSWRKIRKEIEHLSSRYLVAVSGGVDSMFLLDFMRNSNVDIQVVHFDHGIRKNSHEDCLLVEKTCSQFDIPFWSSRSDILSETSNEVDARLQRWKFINHVAFQCGITHVVTAHHADDQIENVLIRLMRGDPHHALSMQKINEVEGLIRYKPLLAVRKSDILHQAVNRRLSWNEDSSNNSDAYDRNFIRNKILPMMATRTNVYQSILTGIDKMQISNN